MVPPSDRAMVLFMLVMVFLGGMSAGLALTTQRSAGEVDRIIAQVPSRPTLHQRLDAIEQRLQGIEERLPPSP